MYNCAIIDLDSICFTAANPNKVLDENNEFVKKDGKFVYTEKSIEEIYESVDSILSSLLSKSKADSYIAFIKGKGNYRYAYNPEYKDNRPKQSPWWFNDLREHLKAKWQAVQVDGVEVDDVVNITRLKVPNSFICAIDKDLLFLEGTHYNWRKDEWTVVSKDEAEYKFWADMIIGQPGDNIKGIPGKGPVAAKEILEDSKCPPARILKYYIQHFGEYEGIKQFHKNYLSLRILDHYEGFEVPEVIKYNNVWKIDE